ncbi:MAG TPA: zinc ribbon domain-containing protein [Blastocatellia bacterium]|nr:zinc ribbon domain-containing protein [Blastocatellia bacterium]
MYCPNCSKENATEQRFCRFCGMALQTVAKELAEHVGAENSERQIIKPNDGVTLRRMVNMLLCGVVALVAGMAVLAVGKGNDTLGLVGLLLVLGGALLAFYGVISPLRAAALASGRGAPQKAKRRTELDAAETKRFPEAMPSVTELTTRSFGATPEPATDGRGGNTQPS